MNMKYIYKFVLLVCILTIQIESFGQNVCLDTMRIDRVIEIMQQDEWNEEFGEGPIASGIVTINNDNCHRLILGGNLYVNYCQDGYLCHSLSYNITSDKELVLNAGDSIVIHFSIPLMFGLTNKYLVKNEGNTYSVMDYSCSLKELTNSICAIILINGKDIEIWPKNIVISNKDVFLK